MEPFPILRPECQILKADDDSMIPRPKLGWRNRKVTFGKQLCTFLFLHDKEKKRGVPGK